MAKGTAFFLTKNISIKGVVFTAADVALTLKTVYTASVDDAIVKAINVVSDDIAARVIDVLINDGIADCLLGSVNIPAASGTNGTSASIDLLSGSLLVGVPFDALGKRVLPLKGGNILKLRNRTQMTATFTVTALAMIEEY